MGIGKKIAQTLTEETAWKLVDRLGASECQNTFYVVRRSRNGRFEIIPEKAVHPIDRDIIAKTVAAFKEEMS